MNKTNKTSKSAPMIAFGKTISRYLLLLTGVAILAVVPASATDDLPKVLARLDASSTQFKSAKAEITWDNVQTEPLPDTDTQAGNIIFERKAGQLRMVLHLKTDNGKPVLKDMVYGNGQFKLYEPRLKQLQVFQAGSNQSQFDTFLTLGFGGSGKDLIRAWDAKYTGEEAVDGHQTWKLELVPKDDSVRKTFPKVLLWIDEERGVTLKQQSFDPSGNYRIVTYHNIQVNGPVPSDAFDLKTPSDTRIVNH